MTEPRILSTSPLPTALRSGTLSSKRRTDLRRPNYETFNEIDYIMADKHQIVKNVEVMNEVNVGSDHRKVRCRVKIDTRRERRHLFHHTPEHLRVPPFYVEEFTIKLQNRNAALEEEDGNINETTRQQSQQHRQISGSDSQRVRNSSQNGQEVLQRNPRSDGETKESPTTNFSSRKS